MFKHHREFVVGKNKYGVEKLENDIFSVDDNDIFCGFISSDEFQFIIDNISEPAFEKHNIDISDFEYEEIPNELIDFFFDLIGDNKDKVPTFYKALEYAKRSGGIIQVCF